MITIHELWCLTSFDHSPSGFLFRFFSAIVKDESDLVSCFFLAFEVAMLESLGFHGNPLGSKAVNGCDALLVACSTGLPSG